jgi:hypothetical protein
MPLLLLIPYTIATVAGGSLSAAIAIALEKLLSLEADRPVTNNKTHLVINWHTKLLLLTAACCCVYLVASTYLISLLGFTVHEIVLPFTLLPGTEFERPTSLLLGGVLFFVNNITQTLASRAGNRNHASYHALTSVIHGFMMFGIGAFVVANAGFLDLVPIAAFGASLGQLFAQRCSKRIECWLGSTMQVEEDNDKSATNAEHRFPADSRQSVRPALDSIP